MSREFSPRGFSPRDDRRGPPPRERSPPPYARRGGGRGPPPRERVSLLVRNLPRDARPDDVRAEFERFGEIKDVYLPRDFHTGDPRGFGFVQFVDPKDAEDAQYEMDRTNFNGREITVVFAEENRKRPDEMRARERYGDPPPPFRGGRRRDYSPSPPPRGRYYDDRSPPPYERRGPPPPRFEREYDDYPPYPRERERSPPPRRPYASPPRRRPMPPPEE